MGYEARCHARVVDADGTMRAGDGTVLLESDALIVRGDARVRVARGAITSAEARDGHLVVTHDAGSVDLALGADAARWLARLQTPPKSRLDKLDVKPGARVRVSGITDPAFVDELRTRTPHVVSEGDAYDVGVVQIDDAAELPKIAELAKTLPPNGSLWVIHPRGRDGVRDTDIFTVARAVGLTYTKVAKFSETHTAEKLVWPRSAR